MGRRVTRSARRRPPFSLRTFLGRTPRCACRVPRWTLGAAALIILVGCGGEPPSSTPTPEPADVLLVVTPTPGTPPPRPSPTAAGQQRYVVREGDSLSGIADRFGVTQEAIQRANDITDPNSIFAGQELVIPAPEP